VRQRLEPHDQLDRVGQHLVLLRRFQVTVACSRA
jgi:hypothetical protein